MQLYPHFLYYTLWSTVPYTLNFFSFNEHISNYFDNLGEKNIFLFWKNKWQSCIKLSSFLYILLWLNFHTIVHSSSRRPGREWSGHSLGSSRVWPWPWPWLITSWRVYRAVYLLMMPCEQPHKSTRNLALTVKLKGTFSCTFSLLPVNRA